MCTSADQPYRHKKVNEYVDVCFQKSRLLLDKLKREWENYTYIGMLYITWKENKYGKHSHAV